MFFDNLEDSEQDTDIFNQLKQLNWHIIATSRHALEQFSEIYTIEVLTVKQCVALFQQHYGQMVRPGELATLQALIELAGQHTLTIELLGKIASEDRLSIASLYKQVSDSGFNLSKITKSTIDGEYNATELSRKKQFELHDHLSKLVTIQRNR